VVARLLPRLESRVVRVFSKTHRLGTERDAARIAALAPHIPKDGVGAEVGVHKGYFTERLLEELRPKRLHLLDPWYLIGLEWNFGRPDRSTINALCAILKRHSNELVSGEVVVHIGWDLDILATFPDATFDWVYLDTTHVFETTLEELKVLQRKVKPDGIIAGDDWRSDPSHPHHGVCRAVRRFLDDGPYELIYASDDDQQWLIRQARASP